MLLRYIYSWIFCLAIVSSYAQNDFQKQVQTDFITASDGDTIVLQAGTFHLPKALWLDGKNNVTILGQGMNKTILSFKKQQEGAEGIKVTNAKNIRLEGFTVQDTKGDAIKTQHVEGIAFVNVKTIWTGKPKKTNGAYGLYPVQCTNVLIDGCEARGASDAGIYVGQSDEVVVRNSTAMYNVAGIEIENTTNADVYNNVAQYNTGGILVFDLPDLQKKDGGFNRVFRNKIIENNYKNFAPKGNIVGQVPPGTGIIVLAGNDVEIFDNTIEQHKTFGVAIASYYITEIDIKDEAYDPYSYRIYIHDNKYSRKKRLPALKNKLGLLAFLKFGRKTPDIIVDGIFNKKHLNENGNLSKPYRICIRETDDTTFANLDAAHQFKNLSHDRTPFDCQRPPLYRLKTEKIPPKPTNAEKQ